MDDASGQSGDALQKKLEEQELQIKQLKEKMLPASGPKTEREKAQCHMMDDMGQDKPKQIKFDIISEKPFVSLPLDAQPHGIDQSHEHLRLQSQIRERDIQISHLNSVISAAKLNHEQVSTMVEQLQQVQQELLEARRTILDQNAQLDSLETDNRALKVRCEKLEQENEQLRLKLYEEYETLTQLREEVVQQLRVKLGDNKELLGKNIALQRQLTRQYDLASRLGVDMLDVDGAGEVRLADFGAEDEQRMRQDNRLFDNVCQLVQRIDRMHDRFAAEAERCDQAARGHPESLQGERPLGVGSPIPMDLQPDEREKVNIQRLLDTSQVQIDCDLRSVRDEIQRSKSLNSGAAASLIDSVKSRHSAKVRGAERSASSPQVKFNMQNTDSAKKHQNADKPSVAGLIVENQLLKSQVETYQLREADNNAEKYIDQIMCLNKQILKQNELLEEKDLELRRNQDDLARLKKTQSTLSSQARQSQDTEAMAEINSLNDKLREQQERISQQQDEISGLRMRVRLDSIKGGAPTAAGPDVKYEEVINLYRVYLRQCGYKIDSVDKQAKLLFDLDMGGARPANRIFSRDILACQIDVANGELQQYGARLELNNLDQIIVTRLPQSPQGGTRHQEDMEISNVRHHEDDVASDREYNEFQQLLKSIDLTKKK